MENNLNVPAVQGSDFLKLALAKKEAQLKNFLGSKEASLRFMSSVMHTITINPKLLECTQESLLGAFMECAAIGLFPSNYSGDCYIVPYKDYRSGKTNAQFQLGYRGVKTLAMRNGVKRIGAQVVYKNDLYKEVLGTEPRIVHEPLIEGDRGEYYRVYAWAELEDGDYIFEAMRKEDVMKIAEMSQSYKADVKYNSKKSLWQPENDPMLWMPRKTAIKQLGKLLPTSPEMDRAIKLDNIMERGGYIEGEGEIVEIPFNNLESPNETNLDKIEPEKPTAPPASTPTQPQAQTPPPPQEEAPAPKPEEKVDYFAKVKGAKSLLVLQTIYAQAKNAHGDKMPPLLDKAFMDKEVILKETEEAGPSDNPMDAKTTPKKEEKKKETPDFSGQIKKAKDMDSLKKVYDEAMAFYKNIIPDELYTEVTERQKDFEPKKESDTVADAKEVFGVKDEPKAKTKEELLKELLALVEAKNYSIDKLCNYYFVTTCSEMNEGQLAKCIDVVQNGASL